MKILEKRPKVFNGISLPLNVFIISIYTKNIINILYISSIYIFDLGGGLFTFAATQPSKITSSQPTNQRAIITPKYKLKTYANEPQKLTKTKFNTFFEIQNKNKHFAYNVSRV